MVKSNLLSRLMALAASSKYPKKTAPANRTATRPVSSPAIPKPIAAKPPNLLQPVKKTEEPKIRDLTNPKIEEELGEEYWWLYSIEPAVLATNNLYAYLTMALSSSAFGDPKYTYVPDYSLVREKLTNALKTKANYIRVIGDDVEVEIPTPELESKVYFSAENTQRRTQAFVVLKQLFPKMQEPTTFTKADRGKFTLNIEAMSTNKMTFESLVNKPLKEVNPSEKWQGPKDIIIPEKYMPHNVSSLKKKKDDKEEKLVANQRKHPGYAGRLWWQIVLLPDACTFSPASEANVSGLTTGKLTDINGTVNFRFRLRVFFRFPLEYALWATGATSPKDFVPHTFALLYHRRMHWLAMGGGGKKFSRPPIRMSSILSVARYNDKLIREQKLILKPRVNAENYTILSNGKILYLPNVNNVGMYTELLKKAYDPTTGELKDPASISGLPNQLIYVDWLQNKMAYTDAHGNMDVEDLNGSIPLDNISICKALEAPIDDQEFGDAFFNFLFELDTKESLADKQVVEKSGRTFGNIRWMYNTLLSGSIPSFNQLAAGSLGENRHDFAEDEEIIKELRNVVERAWRRFENAEHDIFRKMQLQFVFDLIRIYGPKYEEFRKEKNDMVTSNSPINIDIYKRKYAIPNLSNMKYLLPHQAESIARYDHLAKNTVLSVQAGGGKSLLGIALILKLLGEGKIKRPLMIVPGNLVREMITEINKFSNGHINAFPIRRNIIIRLAKKGHKDTEIMEIIKSMPVNTIFVTDYRFLSADRDYRNDRVAPNVLYADKVVRQFPNVVWMNQIGFDFVMEDEAHYLKRTTSLRTQAAVQVMSNANYKVISSGTLISNTATDLVGQFGQLNPRIYGKEEDFKKAYAESVSGSNTIVNWRPGMAEQIKKDSAPFATRIEKRRSDWAFLLPDIKEFFVAVAMTPNQQQFYDNLVQEQIEEIKKDKKLAEMLERGDEKDAEKIEAALRVYFAKCEIFINAPDSNEAFMRHSLSKGIENQLSPKVAEVDKLIRTHFEGGKIINQAFPPQTTKIIVFGYNKAVSEHIYKHTSYKDVAIHYVAGNVDAMETFRNDPKVKILIADEDSCKEGINLQMASMMIRLQGRWSPGDQEQALSRIMRPDPDNIYDRRYIVMVHLLCVNTLEIAKIARLMSKTISNQRVMESDNPNWKPIDHEFEGLPLITMNLKAIAQYKKQEHLIQYYTAYDTYKKWEEVQFKKQREYLKNQIEQHLGKKIEDKNVRTLAMVPVETLQELPGSRKVWTPWVEGMRPVDAHKLNLQALSRVKETLDDDDEGEDDEEDTIPIKEGMAVMTEDGPGKITKVYKKNLVAVMIPKKGEVKYPKSIVYVPTNEEGEPDSLGQKRLHELIKMGKIVTPAVSHMKKQVKEDNKSEKVKAPQERRNTTLKIVDEKGRTIKLEKKKVEHQEGLTVDGSTVNGQQVLTAYTGHMDVAEFLQRKWLKIAPYISCRIASYKGGIDLLNQLKSKFVISPLQVKQTEKILKEMQTATGRLKTEEVDYDSIRNFYGSRHNVARDGVDLSLFPHIEDGDLYFCIDLHSQPKSINKLKKLPRIKGTDTWQNMDTSMVKFFRSKREALEEIKTIAKTINVKNLQEIANKIGR